MIPLLAALRKRGHEIFAVNGGPELPIPHELNVYDGGYWALLTRTPLERAKLIIESYRPQILFTQGWGSVEALELARSHGLRTVLFVIDLFLMTPDASPTPPRTDFDRNLSTYRQADRIVANSEFTQGRVRELVGVEAPIVYPVITAEDHLVRGTRNGTHVTLASAMRIKGIDLLLSQIERIPHPCLVCGEPERGHEERLAATPNLTYVGHLRDMRELYARSKCHLVLSQVPETFGRTIVEANMNGIPVVALDSGACREVVGAAGVIVQHADELPSAIDRALAIPPEVCARNAERFPAAEQVDRVEQLLSSLV